MDSDTFGTDPKAVRRYRNGLRLCYCQHYFDGHGSNGCAAPMCRCRKFVLKLKAKSRKHIAARG